MSAEAGYAFDPASYFPRSIYDLMRQLRVADPIAAYKATQTRQPRKVLAPSGDLLLLMADEASRGLEPACTDRHEYLARLLRVLVGGMFDGLVAPPDILEELCLAQQIIRENGGPSFLDGRAVVGLLNAGPGTRRPSAFTVERAKHLKCDGVWVRASIDREGPGSRAPLERIARIIGEANSHSLAVFVQPSRPQMIDAEWEPVDAARMLATASALGETSTRTWLALPTFDGVDRALRSVSLPALACRIGSPASDLESLLEAARQATGPAVGFRGLALGSSILYRSDDPLAVAGALQTVVRKDVGIETVLERMDGARGHKLDVLSSLVKDDEVRFEGGVSTASYV
ncbi:MAG: hypothetical protein GF320_05735 [Armatimonadia bacterium]|nr:hypothetical protein [Armatimonadia bacterium]